jgi:nitroreductase
MNKKPLITIISALFFTAGSLHCQTGSNDVITLILSSYETMEFSSDPVTDEQLEQILMCGIMAQSGRNLQPWKFTVVRDLELMQRIVKNTPEGNALIVISGPDSEEGATGVYFDCGLAMGNMYIATQGLGLGAHIYGSSVRNINETMRGDLEIPEGHSAVMVLRIGNKDLDAVSHASPRNKLDEVVNYK